MPWQCALPLPYADIAKAHPAVIRTGGMRTEVARGIDVAATASGHDHTGWRCTGCLRVRPALLLTQLAIGLTGEAWKRRGVALGSGRFHGCGLATAAKPARQDDEQHENNSREEIK